MGFAGLFDFEGRNAEDDLSVRDIAMHSGFGRDADAAADFEVSGDAGLSTDLAVITDLGGTGDADLGDEEASTPDAGAMADGHEVADFGARADDRVVESAAFDAATGADFDIVFDDDAPDVRDFMVGALVGGETESIFSDRGIGLDDDAVADPAVFIDGDIGVEDTMVADLGVGSDKDVGVEGAVASDADIFAEGDEVGDMGAFADDGGAGDGGVLADIADGVTAMAVEADDDPSEGIIGIFGYDLGGGGIDRLANDHGGGGRIFEERGIFAIGEKGDVAGVRLFQGGGTLDALRSVADEPSADQVGQFVQGLGFDIHVGDD